MAKFPAIQGEADVITLKMTPMIDVIFQLLIFLMCTLHFRSLETVLETHLPIDGEIESPLKKNRRTDIKVIIVHNVNNPLMPAIKLDGRPLAGYDELTMALTNMPRRHSGNKDASVIIEPQGEVPTQCVVDAINACKKAGVTYRIGK